MRPRHLALALTLAATSPAQAERPTERYAPTQLSVARESLDHARAAASMEEFAQAANYAWQADLDARLAWGMTDAAPLRAQAEAVAAQAAQIMRDARLRRVRSVTAFGR